MTKTAKNKKIINAAKAIAQAMEAETEDILFETEQLVKNYFPAKYVKAALKKVEAKLDQDAIEASFQKNVTKDMFKKTASLEVTAKDMHQAIDKIAKATVDEMEDMLADANEVANRVLTRFASAERPEVEAKLKKLIENYMRSRGVYCAFDRVTYDPQAAMKKAVAAARTKAKKVVASKTGNSILDAIYRDARRV